jgi:hypothetical protein
MPRRNFTDAEKIQLAKGWPAARAAGESQDTYASRFGTSARRIRQFVAQYTVPEPAVRAREIVVDAIEHLRGLLLQIDGAAAAQVDAAPPEPLATAATPADEQLSPRVFGAPTGVRIESTLSVPGAATRPEQAAGPSADLIAHDAGLTGAPAGGQVASPHRATGAPATSSGAPGGGIGAGFHRESPSLAADARGKGQGATQPDDDTGAPAAVPLGGAGGDRIASQKPFHFDMG